MPRNNAAAAESAPVAPGSPAEALDAFAGDPDFMTSLARGLVVIGAFDESNMRLTVAQVSERCGLPRSAVRRCLYTLQCLGYVGAEGSSFYLKPRIVALGHVYLTSVPLPVAAQPVLERVARELGETCSLAVLDRDEVYFISRSTRAPLVSVNFALGNRLPAYCSANGRVLLAALPPHEFDAYLGRAKLTRLTDKTVRSKKELIERVRQVREDGYALVDQEFSDKVRSIAVPIRSGGRVVASMSVGVPPERVGIRELKNRLLPALQAAAAEFA